MNAVRGRVRGGKIELDEPLPEGAEVVVVSAADAVPFDLDDASVAELEERARAADRGNVVSAADVLPRSRR
jgi:hypothetical protein